MIAEEKSKKIKIEHIGIGDRYSTSMHVTKTSDLLAHLLHEHQMGFVNRVAAYLAFARELSPGDVPVSTGDGTRLDPIEARLVRYIMFADEAALPPGGIVGAADYIKDFTKNRKPAGANIALKDLDLTTRLFKNRCSYMLYTEQWRQMPAKFKTRLYAKMKAAISGTDKDYSYLEADERRNLVTILRETMTDLPPDWRQ